ncbi:hypothetical protein [Streptacidiphilus cavernicola]|uniref:Glycosyltransferase RgtA/B/C/D-like domain-containing protein n=1 Tax=Streptacidiphilus cavernicola TaxID=3342716 RepID=A0ABV6W351_9ACTN
MTTSTTALPDSDDVPDPEPRPDAVRERALGLARRAAPALAVYGVLKLIGFAVFMALANASGAYKQQAAQFAAGDRVWNILEFWDGGWYKKVALYGYHPQHLPPHFTGGSLPQNSTAFFPLYPGMMRLVMDCTGLGVFGAGVLVSVVSAFAAAAGIYAVTALIGGHRAGLVAAAIWAVFPGSGVEWAVYSDAIFVALAAWTGYCLMIRRWVAAGLLALVAGLSRPTSVAIIAAVCLTALLSLLRGREDGVLRPLFAMLVAPVGLAGYLLWVGIGMGSPTGYFTLEHDAWDHYFDFGQHTWDVLGRIALGQFDYSYAFPVEDTIGAAAVLMLPILIAFFLRLRPPLWMVVYTLITIASALGSMQIFGNVSRYLLPVFPLFIAPAVGMKALKWPVLATVFLTLAVTSGWYAGYALFELGIP